MTEVAVEEPQKHCEEDYVCDNDGDGSTIDVRRLDISVTFSL